MAQDAINSARAYNKFRQLVDAQGGDILYVDDLSLLPTAQYSEPLEAPATGYLKTIHAREVGETAVDLGAGRASKSDSIDPAVGITILRKVGDHVSKGDPLCWVHANDQEKLQAAKNRLLTAHQIVEEEVAPLPLFYDIIQ
jgi:pyrimidine-nucleoside phosphorylase